MEKLFFLLSGEHETLPVVELKAILEAENYAFKTLENLDQVMRLEADLNCVKAVKHRAAFTKLCCLEIFNCEAKTDSIIKTIHLTDFAGSVNKGESFAVQVKHVKDYASEIDSMMIAGKLGKIVLDKTAETKVDLRKPEKTLVGILTEKRFIFGLKLAEIPPKPFVERRPKKKPFFHPSAMPPKLARCMVNLAQPRAGDLLFDPFCGTGSMLIEAALIGCRVLGSDAQRRMVKGSLKNLAYFQIDPEGLIVADARNPAVAKIDCVVTDPPYGISATTLKRTTKQIVEEVLTAVSDRLDKRGRICMAVPKTLKVGQIAQTLGYKHLESHFVYVHRSLTREITVLKKE